MTRITPWWAVPSSVLALVLLGALIIFLACYLVYVLREPCRTWVDERDHEDAEDALAEAFPEEVA